jgi:hypothetical protein
MNLLTYRVTERLLNNGAVPDGTDHKPVVKFFTPDAAATWLITEMSPDDPDSLFGLCDLGLGCPELGTVSLLELKGLRGHLGLRVERDRHFKAKYPISVYAKAARLAGRIVLNRKSLDEAVANLAQKKSRA